MKVHFIYPEDGDWVHMFIDGEYVTGSHSLTEEQVAAAILGKENVTNEEWSSERLYIEAEGCSLDEIDRLIRPKFGTPDENYPDETCECGKATCELCGDADEWEYEYCDCNEPHCMNCIERHTRWLWR